LFHVPPVSCGVLFPGGTTFFVLVVFPRIFFMATARCWGAGRFFLGAPLAKFSLRFSFVQIVAEETPNQKRRFFPRRACLDFLAFAVGPPRGRPFFFLFAPFCHFIPRFFPKRPTPLLFSFSQFFFPPVDRGRVPDIFLFFWFGVISCFRFGRSVVGN